jgi:hypothetical protein
MVPTGAGTGPSPVGGAGALDKSATPGTPGNPTGPTAGKAPPAPNAAGTATQAGSNAVAPRPATPAPAVTPPKGNGK